MRFDFNSRVRSIYDWLVHAEGSTRALALIRIGLVVNCWARWGDEHVLFRDLNPEALLVNSVFFVSSILAFFGVFTRTSTVFLALTTNYFVHVVGHVYGNESYTHHHTTLLAGACLLLALSPSGRSFSVDRWLALRRWEEVEGQAERPKEWGALWTTRLMALQVLSIYFWGALDKCNPGFLSGARMAHFLMNYYTGPAELSWQGWNFILIAASWSTVTLEFILAFGLPFKRARKVLIIAGLLLHGLFYAFLPVATFSTTMWVLYLALYEPEEVHRVIDKLLSYEERTQ